MYPPVPTRITIELHPAAHDGGAWTAATQVTAVGSNDAQLVAPVIAPVVGEPREAVELPAAYEPADCTCADGLCNEDHANE